MKRGQRGRKLEQEWGTALKAAGCLRVNSNGHTPFCDWISGRNGLGQVWECKETRVPRLDFSAITDQERSALDSALSRGGWAVWVVIQYVTPGQARTWVVSWPDFLQLEATLQRRSIPLADVARPECLIEVFRVDRGNGLGRAWDIGPLLGSWPYWLGAWPSYREGLAKLGRLRQAGQESE